VLTAFAKASADVSTWSNTAARLGGDNRGRPGCVLRRRPAASQDREHRSTLERGRAFHKGNVGYPCRDMFDLRSCDFRMGCLATTEAHFDFYFVPVLEEAASSSHAYLEIMLIRARPQADFFDLGDVLIFLRVARALVLLEPELAQVCDPTHWRIGRRGDFDQVEASLLGTLQRFLDGHDADLLTILVNNAHLGRANLAIGTRAGLDRRT
jgi:hypothetical protein